MFALMVVLLNALSFASLAYVGLDPLKDINWVVTSSIKPMELYAAGKIDAFLGFPPEPQHLSLTLANFKRAHRLRGTRNIGSFSTIL
jgi:hypothetical protein